jgi:hypothetical protein
MDQFAETQYGNTVLLRRTSRYGVIFRCAHARDLLSEIKKTLPGYQLPPDPLLCGQIQNQ